MILCTNYIQYIKLKNEKLKYVGTKKVGIYVFT